MTNAIPSPAGRPRLRLEPAVLAMLGVAAACLAAACGSTAAPGQPSGSASPGSGGSNQLSTIQNSINAAKNATFKAVYTSSSSGGATTTTTIEQQPPNSLFAASDGSEYITQGSTSYSCSKAGDTGAITCTVIPGGANPALALEALYDGQTLGTLMQSVQSEVALHIAGINVSYSNATYAGQASTCMTITAPSGAGKYCVTNAGIVAFYGGTSGGSSSSSSSFELTSFSTNVSSSDFQPPSGSSTQTIPAFPSLPSTDTSSPSSDSGSSPSPT